MTPIEKHKLSDSEMEMFSGCLRFVLCAILAIILSIVTFFLTGE